MELQDDVAGEVRLCLPALPRRLKDLRRLPKRQEIEWRSRLIGKAVFDIAHHADDFELRAQFRVDAEVLSERVAFQKPAHKTLAHHGHLARALIVRIGEDPPLDQFGADRIEILRIHAVPCCLSPFAVERGIDLAGKIGESDAAFPGHRSIGSNADMLRTGNGHQPLFEPLIELIRLRAAISGECRVDADRHSGLWSESRSPGPAAW